MAEISYSTFTASASTDCGKKQLRLFIEKCNSINSAFSLNATYPMPEELNIEASTKLDFGLEIIRWQKGNPHSLEKVLNYPWCKELGISKIDVLTEHLVSSGHADLKLGQIAYDNCIKYGAKDWYDWRLLNWGCKSDAFDSKVLEDSEQTFEVEFSTSNGVPRKWLEKVAKDYPDLNFSVLYDFYMQESVIVQHNAKFFDLEIYRSSECEINSSNLIDYKLGSRLQPLINSEKSSSVIEQVKYPFSLIIVDKDAAIVKFSDLITDDMCQGVMTKDDYKKMLSENIFNSRKTRKLILSYNMDYDPNDYPIPSYSTLVIGSTIEEIIKKSNSIRNELHKPITELIIKKTSESSNSVNINNKI